MIAKSDLVILVLASSALAVGIFRWHQNTQDVNAVTIPASASSSAVIEPVQNSTVATIKTVADLKPAEVANATTNVSVQPNSASQSSSQGAVKTVIVPQPVPVAEVVITSTDADARNVGTYQVRSGDFLGKIATQHNTDVQTLRELNNISGSIIQIGQEILYPL